MTEALLTMKATLIQEAHARRGADHADSVTREVV